MQVELKTIPQLGFKINRLSRTRLKDPPDCLPSTVVLLTRYKNLFAVVGRMELRLNLILGFFPQKNYL
jgi:hypothetical protein